MKTRDTKRKKIYHVVREPELFSKNSGMMPLSQLVGAEVLRYDVYWKSLLRSSWLAGYLCRRLGMYYYGSIYNDLFPLIEEYRLSKDLDCATRMVVHFMWADFAAPSVKRWFGRKKGILIGTYHSAASRLERVCSRRELFRKFDGIMLMSESQRPYFLEAGYSNEKLRVVHHGVNLGFFKPDVHDAQKADGPLRLLLVGATQRDHLFAAKVMQAIDGEVGHLYVRTAREQEIHYQDVKNVTLLPRLSDKELVAQYRQADLLFMPMIDCTANNVILEGMACGTPVITNRVGGISEYVDSRCNFILDKKDVKAWREQLYWLKEHREELSKRSKPVRSWTQQFSWENAGKNLMDFYDEIYRQKY